MHYALSPRTFLFSHYFYTGLRVACGVTGLAFLALAFTTVPAAMTVSIGALCTSLMDLPGPLRHKFNGMLASVVLCSAVTLVISLATPLPWLLGSLLVLISFLASMMVVYGRKGMPLQFAALFIMTLSMMGELDVRQSFVHTALFMGGGLSYLAYAMAVSWLLQRRMKQQVLAEALFELARYMRIKSGFYDVHRTLADQFHQLVRAQVVLADKQQDARDLILRDWKDQPDPELLQVHFGMLDVYELLLSTHTDYELLRRHFADTDALRLLAGLTARAAGDLETIALAVARGQPAEPGSDYGPALQELERALDALEPAAAGVRGAAEALAVLRSSFRKIREVAELNDRLREATRRHGGALPLAPNADMRPFLTRHNFELRLLLSNLSLQSSTFRFALRVAMAIGVGLLVAHHLPYSSHGYWVVLTIAIVLKPSFSMTRQRRSDRLIGTAIGCVITAAILHFVHKPVLLLGFLFIATTAVPAFVYVKYRYTAIAASMQILLQINLLVPGSGHVVGERLLDTVIGVAIATFFSFILPSWEYRGLRRLVIGVLQASQRYATASRELLQSGSTDDFPYRLARKRFMDSVGALGAALGRMLDEPVSKQRAVEDLHLFIVRSYLVAAHVAALRLLWRRHPHGMPRETVNEMLQQTFDRIAARLATAEQVLDGKEVIPLEVAGAAVVPAAPAAPVADAEWSGWKFLPRRLGLLQEDADRIVLRSLAIARELKRADY